MSDWEADLARQRRSFEDPLIPPAPAPPGRSKPESDPSLQMGNRGLITAILLAAAAGVAVIALGYLAVDVLVEVSERAITPAQQFTAAFALATALGALVALVVNVRKQNLAEQLARREITAAFTERFRSAAQQLGGASPAERLAGVYAMAALADEYPTRRQQCVDVLCGYLRLPFDPTTDHLADRSTTTTHVFADGRTDTVHENPASRPFDQQVRQTILTVIRDHTLRDVPVSWSTLDFNLEGAHLINTDLRNTIFSRTISFKGATFSGYALFREANFSGITWFNEATFSGDAIFTQAFFSGATSFVGTSFSGNTFFNKATFDRLQRNGSPRGGRLRHTAFVGTSFSGKASFDGATFSTEYVWFLATFLGATRFAGATFIGTTSFAHSTFFGPTCFDRAAFEDGARVVLDDVTLRDGAQITRDGEPFRGWPPVNGAVDESGG